MITMKSNHKTQADKEARLLTYLSKKEKTEFEKLLDNALLKMIVVNLAVVKNISYA